MKLDTNSSMARMSTIIASQCVNFDLHVEIAEFGWLDTAKKKAAPAGAASSVSAPIARSGDPRKPLVSLAQNAQTHEFREWRSSPGQTGYRGTRSALACRKQLQPDPRRQRRCGARHALNRRASRAFV
ncbi:MAG: hypothetical protein AAF125_21760, partial [Chloroflexota bacterium]